MIGGIFKRDEGAFSLGFTVSLAVAVIDFGQWVDGG